jgi:hypothetical protein
MGTLSKYKTISADEIAQMLAFCAVNEKAGRITYYHDPIKNL